MKGLLAFVLFLPVFASAQNYLMNGTPITDCSGSFLDSGGAAGNYGNNQNLSTTLCSDGAGGTHVRLVFSGADLAAGDVLCFYDGPNAAAPLLSCSTDYPPGQPFVIQATATNPSGCITVTFQSDASGTATGWSAAISCVPSCQTILADLVSTTPAIVPVDTGWIDICPGERVFFTGMGIYPQNNFAYGQSDFTTSFEWNFGDGGIAYGPSTSHRFDQPGGYFVQLMLTDTLGCKSSNLISQRVRVAQRPIFALNAVAQICAGDTLNLNATTDTSITGTTVAAFPITAVFDVEASRSDSLALPDGTGELYETSIFFTEFSPGQVLTNANELESICVTIEHSWMRDIEITLTCPSGQSIILHDHPGNIGGGVNLGIPNDNDNFNPVPGLGQVYCWTPNAVNPTWITYANTFLSGGGDLPPGDYSTFDPISDLVGCPLNGEWTIGVVDLWPADNGYIFNWSLKFQDALYPNIESFTPQFVNWGWSNHPSVFYSSMDSIAASPQNAGTAGYHFMVTDEFGCTWDTLLNVAVLPPTHPDCYQCATNFPTLLDTVICASEPVSLNAASLAPSIQEVRFEAYPDYRLGNANHPHLNPYLSPIGVNSLGYNFLTNPVQQITSVCMDIETDFDSDLNIYLQAPGGQQLMLSTGNGGAGDNYKITCFSPSATVPIVGQAAPFNGTYIPEGNWNSLAGAPVVGDWKLVVSDGFAPAQFGKVKWWSMGFNTPYTVSYSWNNSPSLSCVNCPNPIASPTDTSVYVLTATDNYNCLHTDTVQINVVTFFPGPTGLIVFDLGPGTMTWTWDPVPGSLGYEVSVDGGPWQAANNGPLSHIVSGVAIGQTVQIQVRCISPSACVPVVVSASSVFPDCTLFADIFSTADVQCAGDSTGSAILSVSNATFPVQYFLDTNPVPFPNGDLINILPAGNHVVIVLDALGCRDTVNFTINAPPAIVLNASGTNILCNGDNTGSTTASANGGAGGIAFAWRNCLGGATLGGAIQNNLFAGCYAVTATDGNGCTVSQQVTLTEPDSYVFVVSQDSISCAGLTDGSASVTVTGGTMPYQYLWDNGSTMATANNLSPGFHFVTVTDQNLCQATTLVAVFEPPVFLIDSTVAQNATCFDGNNGASTVFASGGTPPYQYQWSDPMGQTLQKAVMLPAGGYIVTVTDWNGCSDVANVTVGSPTELLATFSNVSGEICAGDCLGQATVNPTGGVGNYQFDWADPNIPNNVQTANNLCPGIYQVAVQDGNGCQELVQVTIDAAIPINLQFTEVDPSCVGVQNGSITTLVSGGAPSYQYLWSNGSTNMNLQNLPCGQFDLRLTDAIGCVQNYSATLDCPQSIVVTSITPQAVQCFGDNNGSISVTAQGGTPPLTYLWSDPAAQTNPTAQNLPAGTYTVTITDDNGCNISSTSQVTEPLDLQVSTSHTNVSCLNGSNGTASAQATGGVGSYTYNWGASGTAQSISNLSAGTYVVTVTDANLCTATASASLSQPVSAVSVMATQTRFACFGAVDGEASVSASGSNGAPFNFEWSNGQTGGGASGLATGLYTVTATDSRGCTGTQVVAIQQLDSLDIVVNSVPPTCFGDHDALAALVKVEGGLGMGDTTQYDYHWSLPGTISSTVVTGYAAGMHTLTVTDLQGCAAVVDFTINEPEPIMVQAVASDASCFGFADGTASVTSIQNATGTVTYAWNNFEITNPINNLAFGNYRVVVTDAKGCTGQALVMVNQPEALTLDLDLDPLVCASDSNASIEAMVSGGVPNYTYLWTTGVTENQISGLGPGLYQLLVRDQNGCTIADSLEVLQPGAIQTAVVVTNPDCFGGFDGKISLIVAGGQTPYRFSLNDGPFGGSGVFIALPEGAYQIRIRDANGCIATAAAMVVNPPAVQVNAGLDTTITLGDSILISPTVNNAVGLTTFAWRSFLVDSFTCVPVPECEEILVKPGFSNTYRVKVTDEHGCMGEDDIRITVEKPRGIYVPTGFTPNGDFENDLLLIHGKSRQVDKILVFKVFDRWGELLYMDENLGVNDTTRGWDGNFRGQPCDPGVYVWLLEAVYIDGHVESQNGNVTLIR